MSQIHFRPLLDRLRWISAVIVAFGHAIALVVADPAEVGSAESLASYLASLRHPAVLIFFVLSGYLVGGSTLLGTSTFSWKRYSIARFSRIYIVLIPALVLIFALDSLSYAINPTNPVYSLVWPRGAIGSVALYDRYSATNVISTFFLTQEITGTSVGSGGQLWSLSYEWIFYFIFPVVVMIARRLGSLWLVLPGLALCAAIAVLSGYAPLGWLFLLWCLGAAARFVQTLFVVQKPFALLGALVCVAAVLLTPYLQFRVAEFLVTSGLALYLSRFDAPERNVATPWDRPLANFSYSLYLVHLPIMVFLTFVANRLGMLPPQGLHIGMTSLTMILGGLVPAFAVAYLFGRMFEARTDRLRRWLQSRRDTVKPTGPPAAETYSADL